METQRPREKPSHPDRAAPGLPAPLWAWLPLSYALPIVALAAVLRIPAALAPARSLSALNALLTATGAVCLTGLTPVGIDEQFTALGHAAIALAIQVGGLLTMTWGTLLAMAAARAWSPGGDDVSPLRGAAVVRGVVLTALGLEAVGALALFALTFTTRGMAGHAAASAFHALSAFCNAGFTLTPDSLEGYRFAPAAHAVIVPLAVLGGLGYPVLRDLRRWLADRRRGLGVTTRLALAVTAAAYLGGVVVLSAAQLIPYFYVALKQGSAPYQRVYAPLTPARAGSILADASANSLLARGSGLRTLPLETDEIGTGGQFGVMALMAVGGTPGGTAGGIKTTTLGVLALAACGAVRRRRRVEVFGLPLADRAVRLAVALAGFYAALFALGTLLLSLSEPYPFMSLAFEAVSAASNNGLSLGVTGDLTAFGRGVLIALILLGRVGPLLLLAMAMGEESREIAAADEAAGVLVG